MEQMTLAERLVWLRKQAKLSQSEVAAKLSISRQAVSKWESGKGLPSLIAYSVLSVLYGVSADVILSGKDVEEDEALPKRNGQSFHEALREARRHRKISQESLAQHLSVSRQSVSKWEAGKAEPDAEHLIALASFLKVSLAQLLPSVDLQVPVPKKLPATKPAKKEEAKPIDMPIAEPSRKPVEAPRVTVQPKPVQPQAKPKAEKLAPELLSRRQLLQERVRLAGQKERAAKAALSQLGIKKKK